MPSSERLVMDDPDKNLSERFETRLSMAVENYLLSIVRLEEQGMRISAALLSEHFKSLPSAEGLGTSLPSVSAMIRRMTRETLVNVGPEKQITLTKVGRVFAESVLRRHRLAERLVVDVLGVELNLAHEEAHRLEHAMSPYLESKIVIMLDYPETCPFGHGIPGSTYKRDESSITLDNSKVGSSYTVDRVPEDDQDLLKYFVDNFFLPDHQITITDSSLSRGVIELNCEGKELVFSVKIAGQIWVKPV